MTERKETRKIYIFYFDQVESLYLFFSHHDSNPFDSILLDMLLGYGSREKPFPIAFEGFQTLNYRFWISSKFARSGFEEFMITFLVDEYSNENFKSLKLKSQLIREFAHELKILKELPKILYEKRKTRKGLGDLGYNTFKSSLIEIYKKYYNLFALPFTGKPKSETIFKLKISNPPEVLIYIVHACLFWQKILFLMKKEFTHLIPDLNILLDYIF